MGTIKTTNIEPIADNGTVTLGSSGDTFTVPSGVTVNMSSATQTGVGGTNTPSFMAFLSASQSISNTTTTKIEIDSEVYDTDSAYDNSSNYRFTVPSGKAGKYYLFATVRANTGTDFEFSQVYIKKNGSDRLQSTARNENYGSVHTFGVDDASAGDYYEVFYYQDSGGVINVSGNASVFRTCFGAYKIIT